MPKSIIKGSKGKITTAMQSDLHERISKAAYYRAEQRDFEPGHESEDWLIAENGIVDEM